MLRFLRCSGECSLGGGGGGVLGRRGFAWGRSFQAPLDTSLDSAFLCQPLSSRLHFTVYAPSRCLRLRLQISIAGLKSLRIPNTRGGGGIGPGRLHAAPPPNNGPPAVLIVSILLASMCCSCLVVTHICVKPLFRICVWNVGEVHEDRLSAGPNLLWSLLRVWHYNSFCASRGGSRGGGVFGPLGTTVPWGVSKKGRAAHGPRYPAVTIFLRLCLACVWFFCLVLSGSMLGFCVVFFWSLGLR